VNVSWQSIASRSAVNVAGDVVAAKLMNGWIDDGSEEPEPPSPPPEEEAGT
jgi:Na+/H+-dicarboxylate symporter